MDYSVINVIFSLVVCSIFVTLHRLILLAMRRLTTILLFAVAALRCAASAPLDSIYAVLDDVIAHADDYVRHRTEEIEQLKMKQRSTISSEERYALMMQLHLDYRAFNNDSALVYVKRCLAMAEKMGKKDEISYCNTLIGHQYVVSGYFTEAQHYLSLVVPSQLNREYLNTYYYYKNHLYRELEMYSTDSSLRTKYFEMAENYRDSVRMTLLPTDELYYQRRCIALLYSKKYDEAQRINDEWMSAVELDSRSYANMAFYRSELYRIAQDAEMQKYWLAVAAISEMRCGVMNQTALWNLAEILNREGDTDRAFAYVECSWRCISQFSTHKRSWVVTPILTTISQDYRWKLSRANGTLKGFMIAIGVLLLFLIVALVIVLRERRVTSRARIELKRANEELSKLNEELSQVNGELSEVNGELAEVNGELSQVNARLVDSNRVKDQYITDFFHICSGYIDKMDSYRLRINRNLKANQVKEVLKFTSSEQLREDEHRQLMAHFDTVFLHLFPTFIDEFNALLRPEERQQPKTPGALNTLLRIFALIRLGVTESSSIAEFLNYSPNSIYAYRARVKNGAIGDRNDFENSVQQIGL